MSARRLVLWRHGQTAWNADNRHQGQIDIPLNEVGREQARHAAQTLVAMKPTHVIASDLERALETGQILADLAGIKLSTDERLRETFAGEWQGMTRDEIVAKYPEDYAAWGGDSEIRPGGGETRWEVSQRVVTAIDDALKNIPAGGTLVVASHGGALRSALGRLLGLDPRQWTILGVLANAQWSVLSELDENMPKLPDLKWRLQEYNAGSLPEPAIGDDK
ncbi:MAG: histidine phosphatase family protein [Actinomycetes bacterium]|jgi:glucosyl-3-phosphoglycerate phosphatase|nr:histidine phosphatase family protein [Candidatus Nanopelagicales bacterium]MDP5050584.1 histidine phosphatase family protein [Candidatus Nanopelagicales bacterium]